jgi:hypothetical protein
MYGVEFHDSLWAESAACARLVLPRVFALWRPKSIIDIGCGAGPWLSVAGEEGIDELVGVDVPAAADATHRYGGMRFVPSDISQPLPDVGGPFAMAMSIEVAEHLPATSADTFVETLTGLAPVVLFSAAYPGQHGIGHINVQWPSYWAERFAARGFEAREITRLDTWKDPECPNVLRTGLLLFVSAEAPDVLRSLPAPVMLDVIPPDMWEQAIALQSTFAWKVAERVERVCRQVAGRRS